MMETLRVFFQSIVVISFACYVTVSDAYTVVEEDAINEFGYHVGEEPMRAETRNVTRDKTTPSIVEKIEDNFIENEGHDRQLAWYPGDPRAVWFISFPESGLPYFLHLVHLTTGRSTATNYGHSIMRRDGTLYKATGSSETIYENGPVYLAPYLVKKMENVATRTHGFGYCLFCHPKKYYYSQFFWKCASGSKLVNGKPAPLQYNPSQVKKMIQFIRDPYDTVVARYFSYSVITQGGDRYPHNPKGFRTWCEDQNDTFEDADLAWLPVKLRGIAKDVPCRQEFVKYAIFHNNVWKMAQFQRIERMTVTYDEYFRDLEGTFKKVNDFLGLSTLPNVNPPQMLPKAQWIYSEFYTNAERDLIERLLRNLVTPPLWKIIREYTPRFVGNAGD